MDPTKEVGPAPISYTSRPTSKDWTKMVDSVPDAVALEGTAATKKVGPQIGRHNIYVNETAYMFCMSLPGVDMNSATFSYDVKPSGEVTVRGETTTGSSIESLCCEILNTVSKNLADSGFILCHVSLPGLAQAETVVATDSSKMVFYGE